MILDVMRIQVVAALEDNAKAHAEIDRLRLVVAALTEALDGASTYLHEITDEGRNLEDPDDSEDYGSLRERISAALALARDEVKP